MLKRIAEDQIHKRVYVTASTGMASFNIEGATIHAFAGITQNYRNYVGLDYASMKRCLSKTGQSNWSQCGLLIIDEISMISADFLDCLDKIGRMLRRSNELPFGGIQVILFGDFGQLPPVGDGEKYAFHSHIWREVVQFQVINGWY